MLWKAVSAMVCEICGFVSLTRISDQYLTFLQEHLHWIILITAHVLADEGKGEQPLVPDSLMQLSGSQVIILLPLRRSGAHYN